MHLVTRRSFVKRSLQASLAIALARLNSVPLFLREALAEGSLGLNGKKLFFLFLRGGNDAINTVIPVADDAYNQVNRPTLFIPKPALDGSGLCPTNPDPNFAINLGNNFAGLHPGLRDLCPVFNAGQLALIHRVGYTRQSRSHFDSQRYWETGAPASKTVKDGIFYRAVVASGLQNSQTLTAVSVQQNLPVSIQGSVPMTNMGDPNRFNLLGVYANARLKHLNAIAQAYVEPHPDKDDRTLLFSAGKQFTSSLDAFARINFADNNFYDTDGTTHLFPINAASNQKNFSAGSYGFFTNLKNAAQILSESSAVISGTELGGFDTHNVQGGLAAGHGNLMRYVGWGIYALRQYFTARNLWDKTVIVTLSEFGRTSKENGSAGTDHAEAGVMFVAGGGVRGGVYQCDGTTWPIGPAGAMFQVQSRYLRRTVDYRSVLGEIIRDHLGVTPAQLQTIIPGYNDPRENLLAGGVAPDGTPIVGELGIV